VSAGGAYTVATPLTLAGSLTFNSSAAAELALTGDLDACAGPCTLDADFQGGHFVVGQHHALRLRNLRLIKAVRGYTGAFTSEPCVAAAALALTGEAASWAYWDGSALVHAGDAPDTSEYCGAVVAAANASLSISDCEISYSAGFSNNIFVARVRAPLRRALLSTP
jgi:hypothetical protein